MTVIYGQRGQAAGSFDGDTLYWRDGKPIGFVEDGIIYRLTDAEHMGSISSGVIYNAFGEPQGFMERCSKSLPLMPPRLRPLPPRLGAGIGPDLTAEPDKPIPAFLDGQMTTGFFQ